MAYVFTHANLIDGTDDMRLRKNATVVISDEGMIAAVSSADDEAMAPIVIPTNAKTIDLANAYLMPGLVNMHVHLCGTGEPVSAGVAGDTMDKVVKNPIGRAYLRHRLKKSAQAELMSGVTTVRSVGDPGFADVDVRDAINAGKYVGPRLLASGTGVTVPGGHGAGLFARAVTTPDEARETVRVCHERGCDLVKLFITGGVFDAEVEGEPGVVRMSLEIAQATVDEAHKRGLPTAAHIESTEGVLVGLQAGVDTIEHGAHLTPEAIELFYTNGVGRASALTTTISPALPYALLDPEKTHSTHVQQGNGDIVYKGIVEASGQALHAGIPVGLGTDSSCPYVTHYDMWREVAYFQKLVGVSNAEALHAATLGNARILHVDDVTGSVEPGKSADLIVLEENPLDDVAALREIKHVMMRGQFIEDPSYKRYPDLDVELDEIMSQLEGRG